MTSSLVGSEMCIRDRARRQTPYQHQARSSSIGYTTTTLDNGNSYSTTVSYTHLTLPTICSV
eukprot:169559-Prorocentrum_lima.AAC.1